MRPFVASLSLFAMWSCAGSSIKPDDAERKNRAPTVEILSPTGTEYFYSDLRVDVSVYVSDAEDSPTDLEVLWFSAEEGYLSAGMEHVGDGEMVGSIGMGEGIHDLQVQVTDTEGELATDEVSITVGPPNLPPNCEITQPVSGDAGSPGTLVTLTALISDPNVGPELLTSEWGSTQDGMLGTALVNSDGISILPVDSLSIGNHTLQLVARDELGAVCTDTIVYTVGGGPEITILEPADGAVVDEGESVDFSGLVSDSIDSPGDLNIQWRSNLDGLLNSFPADSDGTMDFQESELSRGHHTITLFANNSSGMSNDETITLTINGLPSKPDVAISPSPATSSDDLTAVIADGGESIDPEGEEVSYRYTWYRNGVEYMDGPSAIIPAVSTSRNDVWRVVVTPGDGLTEGPPDDEEILVYNSPPQVASVNLTPDDADTTQDLICQPIDVSDWDGDESTVILTWFIDEVEQSETTAILSHEETSRGQEVFCEVTPFDALESGVTVRSNVVTIENSPPSLTTAFIEPDSVRFGDMPTCQWPESAFIDPDGDADLSSVTWYVNDTLSGDGPVAGGDYIRGDILTCVVTPSDGADEGEPFSVSVEVQNTPPTHEYVEMFPNPASVDDTITCSPWGFSDIDGDEDHSVIRWDINGGIWATTGSITGGFLGGDVVSCTVIPNDGYEDGPAITMTQTIGNSTPSIDGVEITPDPATAAETLTCDYWGYTDDDGDPDLSRIQWLVNGSVQSETGATLTGRFSSGDSVVCRVTPFDGIQEGTTRSDSVAVVNAPPEIVSAFFTPSIVFTDNVVQVNANGFDADGDLMSYHYAWTVDGVPVGGDERTLDGAMYFDRGQSITVTITPWDGTGPGISYEAGPILVMNSAPTGHAVVIDPSHPDAGDHDLLCVLEDEASDADGDPVTYTVEWFRDGTLFTDTETSEIAGDTVSGSLTEAGDEWTCAITPNDGDTDGSSRSDTVFVAGWLGRLPDEPATSCLQILDQNPGAEDGVYYLRPDAETFEGYCDMSSDGGGWTLVAYAPTNMGPPTAFSDGDAYEHENCVGFSDFCRFSDAEINQILEYVGSDSMDSFRLVAPGLPGHSSYYWDTYFAFSSYSTPGPSPWWSVAVAYGGENSAGCGYAGSRGAGHDPEDGACSAHDVFGTGGFTNRIYFVAADGMSVGSTSHSTFSWYAR